MLVVVALAELQLLVFHLHHSLLQISHPCLNVHFHMLQAADLLLLVVDRRLLLDDLMVLLLQLLSQVVADLVQLLRL